MLPILANNCTHGSVRLAGGLEPTEGRVEICVEGRWSSVCSSGYWNYRSAYVVCRQLGYPATGMYAGIFRSYFHTHTYAHTNTNNTHTHHFGVSPTLTRCLCEHFKIICEYLTVLYHYYSENSSCSSRPMKFLQSLSSLKCHSPYS